MKVFNALQKAEMLMLMLLNSPMTLAWTLTLTQTSSLVSLSNSTSSHRTPSCSARYSHVIFRPPGRTQRETQRTRAIEFPLFGQVSPRTQFVFVFLRELLFLMWFTIIPSKQSGGKRNTMSTHLTDKQARFEFIKHRGAPVNISWGPWTAIWKGMTVSWNWRSVTAFSYRHVVGTAPRDTPGSTLAHFRSFNEGTHAETSKITNLLNPCRWKRFGVYHQQGDKQRQNSRQTH